ncbi:MAG: thiamine pyrophosphate-dependent enzyme, partial [Geminicoccaceae bacterium]
MIDPPGPGVWFNSATGFGTLGYAAPAAIGASLGTPGWPVICLIGDGGLQFTLSELGCAKEVDAEVIFLVWNNRGYQEIETAMIDAGITPRGVDPNPPDFMKIADAYELMAIRVTERAKLAEIVSTASGPALIEFSST